MPRSLIDRAAIDAALLGVLAILIFGRRNWQHTTLISHNAPTHSVFKCRHDSG